MTLLIGGYSHGREIDSVKPRLIMPKPQRAMFHSDYQIASQIIPPDAFEVFLIQRLGDPKTMATKQIYVIEGISDDKAMELLNMLLLERFINDG
jgi:hypothetical protein